MICRERLVDELIERRIAELRPERCLRVLSGVGAFRGTYELWRDRGRGLHVVRSHRAAGERGGERGEGNECDERGVGCTTSPADVSHATPPQPEAARAQRAACAAR